MIATASGSLAERRASSLRLARFLAILVFLGGVVAALGGLLLNKPEGYALGPIGIPSKGAPGSSFTNLFGKTVELDGQGLYRRDSVSGAATYWAAFSL